MKLRTEIVCPDSTSAYPYPAARVDDDGQDYLHDAAAAHALMQAIDEFHDVPLDSSLTFPKDAIDWLEERADVLMRGWGFADGESEE